ncbi:MAG: hypothetical protein JWQ27_994 [Ferruginibacter sp.]|nr:hypothetical protein [Ferruginibacter sp.]
MISMNCPKYFFNLTLLVCLWSGMNTAKAQSVSTSIDRKSILIGEQINYEIKFTLPAAGYQVDFNIPDSIPHFDMLSKAKSDSTDAKGNYLVMQRICFTSFDSGQWPVPAFAVNLRNGSASYTLNTDAIMINVGYMPADSSGQLRDIKPVMDVFVIDNTWIYIAIGAVIFIILLLLLYRYFKNRKKKEKPLFESKLTAYEEAVGALKELQATNLYDPTAVKLYHSRLSEIVKKYYSRKEQRNLLNKTTSEILLRLKEHDADAVTISSLAEAMRTGDAVKFAKYIPSAAESEQSLQQVRSSIDTIEKQQTIKT